MAERSRAGLRNRAEPRIQVDMFEVQLGAAILIQFATKHRRVRVLADAGVKASGYESDHVLKKLLPILGGSGDWHIDLVIGTHYDEDHLNGLVPVVKESRITIGEDWMPPVANDTKPHALDAALSEADLLPHQFYGEEGVRYLEDYLATKRADCETLLLLENPQELNEGQTFSEFRTGFLKEKNLDIEFFRVQLDVEGWDHGTYQEIEPDPDVEATIRRAKRIGWESDLDWPEGWWRLRFDFEDLLSLASAVRARRPEVASAHCSSLANIRKAAAKDAINAKALHDVVVALRKRGIPLRSEIISNGEPRRYVWRNSVRRFVPIAAQSEGPDLMLLGPSRALVCKHWNRLPVEQAARVALSFTSEIKSITPSNQLSYVVRFGFLEQGILVSGDAGFVDFKAVGRAYSSKLLSALLPLHVIQVAHHGGNNAHFYRVLTAAAYPEQAERSFMLLSHATDDPARPSPEFEAFLLSTLKRGDDVRLVFTSRPIHKKVANYIEAIHPVVGARNDVGDVRLVFRRSWNVRAHAVCP